MMTTMYANAERQIADAALNEQQDIRQHGLLIDNSQNVYHPVRLSCGVVVPCRPTVLSDCPSIVSVLERDVQQCLSLLPASVSDLVLRTRIWVNLTYQYGSIERPQMVNHTTTHHHEAWLLWYDCVCDTRDTGILVYITW
jgi:hypothetical protein